MIRWMRVELSLVGFVMGCMWAFAYVPSVSQTVAEAVGPVVARVLFNLIHGGLQ